MPLNGAVFALDGILIGAGDTRFLMWGMLAAAAVYVPIALLALDRRLGDRRRVVRARRADRGAAGDLRRALRVRALGGHGRAARVRATLSAAMRRLALIVCVLGLALAAPVAAAQTAQGQGGSGAFGPLPQPAPEETADPDAPARRRGAGADRPHAALPDRRRARGPVRGHRLRDHARRAHFAAGGRADGAGPARPGPAPARAAGEGQGAGQDEGPAARAAPESLTDPRHDARRTW